MVENGYPVDVDRQAHTNTHREMSYISAVGYTPDPKVRSNVAEQVACNILV